MLRPYLLYVGDCGPRKNVIRLIEAFKILVDKYHIGNHTLVIAGPDNKNGSDLGKGIIKFKLKKRVKLLGYVNDVMLSYLYQNATAFVYPSLYEGFGFPPLEAMKNGIPVVASQNPCMPEILGDSAIYFDPNNVAEIAYAIHRVLTDSSLRQKLIYDGYRQANFYTWEKTIARTIKIYQELLTPPI